MYSLDFLKIVELNLFLLFNMQTSSTISSNSSTLYKKLVFFSNEFPNDDLKPLFQCLHRHTKDKRFRSLSIFIEECTATLKEEASRLPCYLQDLIPRFETILSLADGDYRKGPLGAAMESVFLCVLQLGMFIGCLIQLSALHYVR